MKKDKIIIGSRGSKLALIYAEKVKSELKKEFSQLEKEIDIKSLEMSVEKLKTKYFSQAKHLSKRRTEKAKEFRKQRNENNWVRCNY